MKKFFIKLICLSPVLIVVVCVNYLVDPVSIFGQISYTKDIAKIFIRGSNIVEAGPWDERLVQKYYIQGIKDRKEVVVLGSSRSMEINSSMFPNYSFHNNSIGGAILRDYLAIYDMYRERKMLPDYMIIELTPWLLNGGYYSYLSEHAYSSALSLRIINENYNTLRKVLKLPPINIPVHNKEYKYLISPNYFQKSIRQLIATRKTGFQLVRYFETDAKTGKMSIRLADGSVHNKDSFYANPIEAVRQNAMDIDTDSWGLMDFSELDPDLKEEFELFIDLAKKEGVTLLFYIPPYHQIAYNLLAADVRYKIIADEEKYFREFAQKRKITVLGSYNPETLPISESDFGDNFHTKNSGILKIFGKKIRLPKR